MRVCARGIVRCVVDSESRPGTGRWRRLPCSTGDQLICTWCRLPRRLGCLVMPRRGPFVPIHRSRKWDATRGRDLARSRGLLVRVSADLHGAVPRGCDFPVPEKIRKDTVFCREIGTQVEAWDTAAAGA